MSVIGHKWFGLSLRSRVVIGVFFVGLLVTLGSSVAASARRWIFSRQETAIRERVRDADDRARMAEGKALLAEAVLREKREQLAQATARAEAAEAALLAARNVTVKVRGDYDKTRNRDLSAVSGDIAELCARLRALGYACVR